MDYLPNISGSHARLRMARRRLEWAAYSQELGQHHLHDQVCLRTGGGACVQNKFVTILDVIEAAILIPSVLHLLRGDVQRLDWAREFQHWPLCPIDGSAGRFDGPVGVSRGDGSFPARGRQAGAPQLFHLSTRAGGLGINLTAADTAVFYDQDWARSSFHRGV
ncbi:hypothetical protein BJV74DRAFT_196265 [Russula compacta]|nr:hypothetical protein BJV74DRAFT_196265 [Russula compacta]